MADRRAILAAWITTRLAMARLRDRRALERHQVRLWRRMAPVLAATPALAADAGRPLADLPIRTVDAIRADFERWNSRGLALPDALAVAEAAERGEARWLDGGISAGFSTGTGGTRGLFLASPAERARYVGQALARLLPAAALLSGRRITLCLRADSALYRDVGRAGRFAFRFVPLAGDAGERARRIVESDPQILIAPAHVLAGLARRGMRPAALEALYYGAEPMGDAERGWIADRLGRRPDPLYQATEGFLGAPCAHGMLHLNEQDMVVELEPIAGCDRFRPIVTDLRRTTQPIVRVRLDDLVEPLGAGCACGAPTRAIQPIEGRFGDLWRWGAAIVPPRAVEDALAAALGPDAAWRAVADPAGVLIEGGGAGGGEAGVAALRALLDRRGVVLPVRHRAGPVPDDAPKRRRVRWVDHGG